MKINMFILKMVRRNISIPFALSEERCKAMIN